MLDELERLHKAATPAPWDHDLDAPDPTYRPDGVIEHDCGAICHMAQHANIRTVDRTGEEFSHSACRLIVAARNALPALIAAAREAERWRGEVKKWYDRAIRQSESRQEAELRCVELQAEAEQLRAELRARRGNNREV